MAVKNILGVPMNIAHRGASGSAPENTLAAFRLAFALGAQGVELDVHVSKDRQLVVIHDDTVDRTTDGKGAVADLTLAEIKRFEAGVRFSPEFAGEHIPTLAEALEVIRGRGLVNVELKPGNPMWVVQDVIDTLEAYGMVPSSIISSFSLELVVRAKEVDPGVRGALLFASDDDPGLERVRRSTDACGLDGLHPAIHLVDQALLDMALEKNLFVNVWTVNDPGSMEQLIERGVDGIITDYPEVLADLIRRKVRS